MDLRQDKLTKWVDEILDATELSLTMVSGDASFRRYFRASIDGKTWIAMDAPPEKEDSTSFVAIAKYWLSQGVQVPVIHRYDLELGFLLLSDFGDRMLLPALCPESPKKTMGEYYYHIAMQALVEIQKIVPDPNYVLPLYDNALLQREMALFPDWLLTKKLGLNLSEQEQALLTQSFNLLAENALAQPQVSVHRDYHARNLMVLKDDTLGVIDFQDAVLGPVTYDLVSLLRDCYIVWPDEQVEQWCLFFYEKLKGQGLLNCEPSQFKTWFDLMGLQRHLKAAGIFARLSLRDGKHGYLEDIPRTVDYLVRVSKKYPALKEFYALLVNKVVPALKTKLNTSKEVSA